MSKNIVYAIEINNGETWEYHAYRVNREKAGEIAEALEQKRSEILARLEELKDDPTDEACAILRRI